MLAVFTCLFAPAAAIADANASFEDGNRLFRDDLYWAALLRYREAADAGMDTPLLHFNTGVAHYKAQQYTRARQSLLRAAEEPALRAIAHFNLGLTAYAAGNEDEAVDWFRRARDQEQNSNLRELAMIAITRIQTEQRQTDPVLVREEKRREEARSPATLELEARVGFGTDDNIFRSPDQPYIDYADPTQPIVVPVIYSGSYAPVDFRARYAINSYDWEKFFAAYRLSGNFYDGEQENNADEYVHELRFGSQYDRREEDRRSRVYSAFTIAEHDEIYVDPDTGDPRSSNGQVIDDRMDYKRYGPELAVLQRWGSLSFGLRMKGQLWDYTETGVVPEYDHEYFLFGGNVQYRFAPSSLLRFTVEKSSRRYSSRPSYDLDGNQLITNPALRYDYLSYGMLARQRITDAMWFGFGYELTDRQDRYVGYNDFTRDTYQFEFHWTPARRFDLALNGMYRVYDYPNAFAFNDPIGGPKTLETLDGELLATWRLSNHFRIVFEADYRENASTDFRIQYDRLRFSLGVEYEL